ncbi:hypothetical protein [Nocardioides sp. SYSU D00038]|uniref:hypothetical protein n=1 Tax=Nocardioides sp. SYSU D00038 TaxID=2812554 RepID=UPI001967FBF2|nr:hypothetical protein [Nocardioides sp. SYSU D00038]
MTETLKSLLHDDADGVDFAAPDLDAITRTGDRRRRTRRGFALLGTAALVAATAGGVVLATGDDGGDRRTPVATDPLPTDQVTWVTGDRLHTPTSSVDLGHEVRSYVRTSAGFAFVATGGAVFSFVDGTITEVGSTSAKAARLVGDTDGSRVGWVDASDGAPVFVVHDLATGETRTLEGETSAGMGELADEDDPAYFAALDGDDAWWRDARGLVRTDLGSGEATVVDADQSNGFGLLAVEDGLTVTDGGDAGTRVGGLTLPQVYGSAGALSPDGTWVSVDADEPSVFATADGTRVSFDLPGFATGYEFLDDETVVMIAQARESDPVQLLTCVVPAGTCTVAVPDLGSWDDLSAAGLALPVGEPAAD